MTNRKDGGAAFPLENKYANHHDGMSLRDWFAGMALQGLISKYGCTLYKDSEKKAARASYSFADAMLAEREKAGSDE